MGPEHAWWWQGSCGTVVEPARAAVLQCPAFPAGKSTLTMQGELTIADLRFDPPELQARQLEAFVAEHYGIRGAFERLPGERDQNVRIRASDGSQYVLKISGASEDRAVVDLQVKALLHIEAKDAELAVPRVVRGLDGGVVYATQSEKGEHAVRLLTWLPGILYQDGAPPSFSALRGIGAFQARLCRALTAFAHPAATHFMPWDIGNGLVLRPQMQELLPADVRQLVAPALQRLEHEIYPRLQDMRAQVIHHDGHGANLLRASVSCEDIVGVIDFGDMIYGPLIFELAVSGAHLLELESEPITALVALVEGFHDILPLRTEETDVLADLIVARLVLTLALFEFRRLYMENPPEFVTSDQPGIILSLRRWMDLDQEALKQRLRECLE